MHDLLPFIIVGLATGSVYGLAGTGLVLTYKTSGVFNFGYGAMATVAAYVFYYMHVDHGTDWKVAAFVSVLIVGPLMGLLMEPLARALARRPIVYQVAGTVGLILVVEGLGTIKYGTDSIVVPQYLPKGTETFTLFGARFGYDQLTIMILSLVVVTALYLVFRFTRSGMLMRAVVDDPDLVSLAGSSPTAVRRLAWVGGSILAALSGVLVLPEVGLAPAVLTLLVVQAFGAAAIGAFSNIPLTFVGGLLIGVVSASMGKYVVQVPSLAGLPGGLPFLTLFIVLLVLPKRKLASNTVNIQLGQSHYHGPVLSRVVAGTLVVAALMTVPLYVSTQLAFFTMGLSLMVVLLSLGLLVKTSGQVSLSHAAFMALGACLFSDFAVNMGLPWFVALLLSGLCVVPIGAIIAIPAIRLSGLFLALATYGFGILVEQFFYPMNFMFGALASGRTIPRPRFADSDGAYYYLVLAFVVVTAGVMILIHEGRLGRVLRGMAGSPVAVGTFGLSTNVTRVIVFAISTFFAAIGGVLYSGTFRFAASGDPRFLNLFSLLLLVILILGPFREPWYALLPAVGLAVPAFWTSPNSQYWLNVITGVFAIQIAIAGGTPVLPQRLRGMVDTVFRRKSERARRGLREPAVDSVLERPAQPKSSIQGRLSGGLRIESLTVSFGGVRAVDDLNLVAPLNGITGLIGPNGAGKTTTFNACSGLNRPSSGTIVLGGHDVSHSSPAKRARLGLGRTFQRMELCNDLTVADNVALGLESSQAGVLPWRQITATRSDRAQLRLATNAALDLCGILDIREKRAGELSTGQRRLVELARCLAGPFDFLLLDEPSSGLDAHESDRLAGLLIEVVKRRGCGILLVEHDVEFVMRVCQQIYVMDLGRLLFAGSPAEVASSDAVKAAYLGESAGPQHGPEDLVQVEGGI